MTLPRGYLAALGGIVGLFAFFALVALGSITLESVFLLLLNYVFQVFAVTVLAALGGVFLGMVLAHRMLASRGFTPFERELLEAVVEVRAQLQKREQREIELQERLASIEKKLE